MVDLGDSTVGVVRNEVINHTGNNVVWHEAGTSFETSFVGLVQLYSNKSQNSLKASSFQFYPLHITLLTFSEGCRKNCIMKGKTLLGFLPVDFFSSTAGENQEGDSKRFGRKQRIKTLHLSINIILEELKDLSYCGFLSRDRNGYSRRCHPCISSYCCDLPESKGLVSVRNGNQGRRNCHRCMAKTSTFKTYTTFPLRNGEETRSIITIAVDMRKNGRRSESEELLKRYSLTEQLSVFDRFPFLDLHPSLNVHSIFMVEPLHEFH